MKSVQETFDNYYGRARTGKWETKTGKSTKTPNFIPKISRKKEDSKIDASLLQNSQWADTFVVDLPFMNRWELLTPIEKGELQQKTILLDLRTDKLTSGDSTYLKGFKNVLSKKALKQESDAINHIFQRIESYCNKEGKRLTEADITPSFIDDFIEMVIEKEYDILTAPYFKMKFSSPLSEIIDLNKEYITKTREKMNQFGIKKDIMGVICISKGLLQNKEAWDSLFEFFDVDVDVWGIRLSPLNFKTKDILPLLWEFIDEIVFKIGSKLLLGLDFELYDDGPFGFPLLAVGLDAFSSSICETDEFRRKEKPSREKPFGFYYLRKDRFKKHVKELLPDDIQCDCSVCRELVTDLFNEHLDRNALQARLKRMESTELKKKMKHHFLYCREQEISEYEKTLENEDFLAILKGIARNSDHSDWGDTFDQGG